MVVILPVIVLSCKPYGDEDTAVAHRTNHTRLRRGVGQDSSLCGKKRVQISYERLAMR